MTCHILIVDDEPNLREFLGDVFIDAGYEVDIASDGIEAIAKVDQHPPVLIILDLMMPRLDGYGTLAALEQRGLVIPVLIMSASALALREAIDKLGREYCIDKPFDADALLARVRQILAAD